MRIIVLGWLTGRKPRRSTPLPGTVAITADIHGQVMAA
jgi:hypothetical protein